MEQEQVAILGLGLIGTVWAENLAADRMLGASWNRSPKARVPKFEAAIEKIPGRVGILHTVVSDESAATSVIEQLLPFLEVRHLVIQSTTIDPDTSSALKAKVEQRGAQYLEAPFTGSLPAAQSRKTIFYMGGERLVMERAAPYLKRLGERQFRIGTNKQACFLKLVMNLQLASAVEALSEALTISRGAGIDDQVFFEAFRENASFSGVAALKEAKLRSGEFAPQFSIKHMSKDMRLLTGAAGAKHFPALETVRKVLSLGEERGLANEDFSAIIKLLET